MELTLQQQEDFIREDHSPYGEYNGLVIEYKGEPVGLCGVKDSGEFTLGLLPYFQHKGIATKAMRQLIKEHPGLWSQVFVGNPALEYFIGKLGFKVTGVEERSYYKKGIGLVDTVRITHE